MRSNIGFSGDAGERVGFWTFVDRSFTGADLDLAISRYSIGLGEVGPLGYLTAALEVIGFCAGGWLVYEILKKSPWCASCQAYFRTIAQKKSYFATFDQFEDYWEGTGSLETPEAEALVAGEYSDRVDVGGAVYLLTDFRGCRGCGDRLMSDSGQVHVAGKWKVSLEIERNVPIPKGFNVERFVQADPPSPVAEAAM